MGKLVGLLSTGQSVGRPLAAITVDDGYADFHEVALPVLRELNVPATIYATAGFIDRQCWLWWDALRYVIDGHPGGAVELRLGSENITLHLSDARSHQVAWNDVADRLVTRNHLRATAIREITRAGGLVLPDTPTAAYEAMTWDQLREAAAAGVEVGGHTMTHAFLPGLDSESLQAEIVGGRALLERRLGVSIRTFAYPNGMPYDVDPAVEAAVRSAGFQAAVVAYPRVFCRNQMFQIGRWSVDPHSQMLEHVLSGASEIKLRFKH
jgi:peptidoglycan/xylan/chitin deacetylase (PgdA/CDA1 family)